MQLMGIGLDVIAVERLRQALERRGDGFRRRLLGPAERLELAARCLSGAREAEYLAGRWAAKEAVAKALGTGLAALGWRNIEITGTRRGRPSCVLSAGAAQLAGQLGVVQVLVTITHEGGVAAACAVAMTDAPPVSAGV